MLVNLLGFFFVFFVLRGVNLLDIGSIALIDFGVKKHSIYSCVDSNYVI